MASDQRAYGYNGTCDTVCVQENTISGNYHLVNLSMLILNYVVQNGITLTGTINNKRKISVAPGASITLQDVSINADGADSDKSAWAGLTCLSDATITLVGENVVKGCYDGFPDIQAGDATNTTLTIGGTGSLTATGGTYAAGIGSRENYTCGNISISGGTIEATGGVDAAGIGSGRSAKCGNITIRGDASGTAKGGEGSQYDIGPGLDGTCGTVTVEPNTISGRY